MNAPNPWKRDAQKAKARKLVKVLDAVARERGVDPVTNAAEVAMRLADKPESWWLKVAAVAEVVAPSAETVALVVHEYQERARLGAEVA